MFTPDTIKEIRVIADMFGWNQSSLLAVAEVESGGVYEWTVEGKKLPPIRFEGHYFHARLTGAQLTRAMAEGLAHPRKGHVKNPRSYAGRYKLFQRAFAINQEAALESISMGIGQVMGKWWDVLGYKSVRHMFQDAISGVSSQVTIMAQYISVFKLGKHITGKPTLAKFKKFARAYNGKGYAKNKYHTKMLKAANRWMYNTGGAAGVAFDGARERLKILQKDLNALGYNVGDVDGLMGKLTKRAVTKFQKDHGLVADGIPGTMTRAALDEAAREEASKEASKAIGRGTAMAAPAVAMNTIGQTILDKVTDIQAMGLVSDIIDPLVTGLTVIGVCMLCYGFYKKYKSGKV